MKTRGITSIIPPVVITKFLDVTGIYFHMIHDHPHPLLSTNKPTTYDKSDFGQVVLSTNIIRCLYVGNLYCYLVNKIWSPLKQRG